MFQLLEQVEEAKKDYEQTKSEHDGLLAELASCIYLYNHKHSLNQREQKKVTKSKENIKHTLKMHLEWTNSIFGIYVTFYVQYD